MKDAEKCVFPPQPPNEQRLGSTERARGTLTVVSQRSLSLEFHSSDSGWDDTGVLGFQNMASLAVVGPSGTCAD
ncbi:hypothetical protein C2E23DRAFT_450712 [Lenzites betulinus]|nr:hypothetical protein C2E23DRAFT_450712 [Lenzites betulinus]